MKPHFSLTTTLPYVNADPHIGFALEIVQADIIARHRRLLGDEVIFNTGTDEHGIKIYRKALEAGKDPQAYVDEYAARFGKLKDALNLSYTHFIRTTNPEHKKAAQEFWKLCDARGDIYKKAYKIKYCVGCELEKTDSELVDGKCPLHPNHELEIIEEENYFFRFSRYGQPLLDWYAKRPDFVVPESRLHEIQLFVERGLEDFSISRLKAKMPWGVAVPGDDTQVMYVWFDALVNYISTLGWPASAKASAGKPPLALATVGKHGGTFGEWWPSVQCAGKDNLRQQSAMWQAMLMSAGIEPSRQILIHGFITSNGQKMSKSLGNVINPFDIVGEYGTDALRYFLARHIHPFEDSDFTMERFKEAYNANLANGLGNLVARVMKMAVTHLPTPVALTEEDERFEESVSLQIGVYEFNRAMEEIFAQVAACDTYIQETQPFKAVKVAETKEKALADIEKLVHDVYKIAIHLTPFMPATADAIKNAVTAHTMPPSLFPRKE